MAEPFKTPLVSPVLIGREHHLEALLHLADQVHAGQGQLALLAGEAGIGKSRLLAEVQRLASVSGFRVLQGRCFEPDALLPYAPLLDLVRTFLSGRDPASIGSMLGPLTPYLRDLLPERANLLPQHAPAAMLEPAEQRRR
jgi:predicted ATPase